MAPVGSRESLVAAFQAGAGSVYFGVGTLNMRSHSANHFDISDLREIASLCMERGVKSYLTVNTIIYDEDMVQMREIVDAACEAGISAIIASDLAVIMYCREKRDGSAFVYAIEHKQHRGFAFLFPFCRCGGACQRIKS